MSLVLTPFPVTRMVLEANACEERLSGVVRKGCLNDISRWKLRSES